LWRFLKCELAIMCLNSWSGRLQFATNSWNMQYCEKKNGVHGACALSTLNWGGSLCAWECNFLQISITLGYYDFLQ
jgi:hypothetical protein